MLSYKILHLCLILTVVLCDKLYDNLNNNAGLSSESEIEILPEIIQPRNDFIVKRKPFHNFHGINSGNKMVKQQPLLILNSGRKKKTLLIASPSKKIQKFVKYPQHKNPKTTVDEVYHTYVEEHIHVDEYGKPIPGMKNERSKVRHVKTITSTAKPQKYNYMKNKLMKELEQREEQKVEATMDSLIGGHKEIEMIEGKPFFFSNGWKPIEYSSTEKPKILSPLHTSVMEQPIAPQVHHEKHVFEIKPFELEKHKIIHSTKNSNKPKHESEISNDNEKPNYPEYFLKQNKEIDNSARHKPDTFSELLQSSATRNIRFSQRRPHKSNENVHEHIQSLTTLSTRHPSINKIEEQENNSSSMSSLLITILPEQLKSHSRQKIINKMKTNESLNKPVTPSVNINGRGNVKFGDRFFD